MRSVLDLRAIVDGGAKFFENSCKQLHSTSQDFPLGRSIFAGGHAGDREQLHSTSQDFPLGRRRSASGPWSAWSYVQRLRIFRWAAGL